MAVTTLSGSEARSLCDTSSLDLETWWIVRSTVTPSRVATRDASSETSDAAARASRPGRTDEEEWRHSVLFNFFMPAGGPL